MRTLRIPLAILLALLAPICFADPRLDHVEDELTRVLPGYQRYVPPSTQPTDPPSTGQVDPIPYPPAPEFIASPGADLAKLPRAAALSDGEYTTSGDIRQNCVALNPGKATLRLKTGQTPQLPDVFAGTIIDGGGVANSDDLTKAGTFSGLLVHTCTIQNSAGFGLLTNKPGARVTNCIIAYNGSGGIGGTQKGDVLVDNCEVHHNNLKYKRTNSNKWTRARVTVRDCNYHDNAGRDIWSDNYVQSLTVLRCRFKATVTDKSGDPWKAGNVAAELTDKLVVKDCTFDNDVAAGVYINEVMLGTLVEGNRFTGRASLAIELRDLARGKPFHTLKDVTIRANTFNGAKTIGASGAGNKIGLSKNRITIEGNTGNVSVKIPA